MVSRLRMTLFMCVMLVAVVTASAQTAAELKNRFGPPDESGRYTVRKGVLLRISVNKGRGREMVIEPTNTKSRERSTDDIPSTTANEIIDELAPAGQLANTFGRLYSTLDVRQSPRSNMIA